MRKHGKIDANHAEIVSVLRKAGYSVLSLAAVGKGCPDILVGRSESANILLEIKDGSKPPSKRNLTKDQRRFFATWKGQVAVVKSPEEALDAMFP